MRIRKKNTEITEIKEDDIELIAKVSDALAHPVRLHLFRYIMQCNLKMEKVATKNLVEKFDYAQSTISQHMKKLVKSGLVEGKKEEKFMYYYAHIGLLNQYVTATKKYATCDMSRG